MEEQQKSFFERLGEILNAPLPGTVNQSNPTTVGVNTADGSIKVDDSLLARVKDILNTPLPGSDALDKKLAEAVELPGISESDVQENWWETDWAAFKAHQEQDRLGLNVKQRQIKLVLQNTKSKNVFSLKVIKRKSLICFNSNNKLN